MKIQIKRIREDVPMPEYKTSGAVAFDLALPEEAIIEPGETKILPTGLVVYVPAGHALILAPRSSNAKKGIILANGVGVIDQDYCGPNDELHLALHNIGKKSYTIKKGERIAQGLFTPVVRCEFEEVEGLNENNRGGFGSTG